ncbi:MAG: lytic transglycosylase domain-containing protein [Armatimonadetes bacterium]|nr:lytic transglycosylase domain-containing protein [Armatimonadota bacterium]
MVIRRYGAALALAWVLGAATPAAAQSAPFYSGTSYAGGQAVHSYTNAGAVQYHRAMRVRGGEIYNAVQKRPPAPPPGPRAVPKLYSFAESAHQKLPRRHVTVYQSIEEEGRVIRKPAMIDLSEIIVSQARQNNMDPLIVELVIQHESAFNPYAVSRSGAQGLMQLMPGTAALMGVRDSFDPADNVRGGTRYLAQQLERFKDLRLALAAYNAGPGAVASCGGIPPYAETINYVDSIVGDYASRQKKADKKTASRNQKDDG